MNHKIPTLNLLFDTWVDDNRFFHLKKFIFETRKSVHHPIKNSIDKKKLKNISKLNIVSERIRTLCRLINLFIRALKIPKGLPVIFNHTSRFRKAEDGIKSLYLNSLLKKNKRATVFEDVDIKHEYNELWCVFQAQIVYRSSQILSAFLIFINRRDQITDRDIATFYVARFFWYWLFRILRPSSIRLFVWYGKEPIIAAAKSLGIEVADVQHGIIYKSHPLYKIDQANHLDGSDYLLPDKCFVYGEYWKSQLVKAGWKAEKILVIGYFLDIARYKSQFIRQPYVLYTSQPNNSHPIISHIKSIQNEVRSRGMQVIISKHPSEPNNTYDDILSDMVQIFDECDSYDLLRHCSVHVSVSSTLLWEAMLFGKSNYLLDYGREAIDLLSDFLEFGYGRCLDKGEFPEPFLLPKDRSVDYFFSSKIDSDLIFTSELIK